MKARQKVVNEGIQAVNAARTALGAGEVTELTGVCACPTNCLVAKGLPVRNRTTGGEIRVRSRKTAEKIAAAWGTTYIHAPSQQYGEKDYPYEVEAPTSVVELISQFDSGFLRQLDTTVQHGQVRSYHAPGKFVMREMSTVRSHVNRTTELALSTDETMELIKGIFG